MRTVLLVLTAGTLGCSAEQHLAMHRLDPGSAARTTEGMTWYWGDLHAHSNWSTDGCEDVDNDCADRNALPAQDFFRNAGLARLDFAAITDHSEADRYYPHGESERSYNIWRGQSRAAEIALSRPVLPILGYEWSYGSNQELDGHVIGGHRTVLLSDPTACVDYRLPSEDLNGGAFYPAMGDRVYTDEETENYAAPASALWDALDAADDSCGTSVRWITFSHHSAYRIPQATDWYVAENAPEQETVVEIYSEHGSSECTDTADSGCDFGVNPGQSYYSDGAVQTALSLGYQLGFIAGTDSHDARPGSLRDGPGEVGYFLDTDNDGQVDAPHTHYTNGGLTGVLIDDDDLDSDTLFDAIEARRTVATSGPRPRLTLYAEDGNGNTYLPGEVLAADDGPFTLYAAVDRARELDADLDRIERIDVDLTVADYAEDTEFTDTWSPQAGDFTYIRLRYETDDGEERVWVSPWFAE